MLLLFISHNEPFCDKILVLKLLTKMLSAN